MIKDKYIITSVLFLLLGITIGVFSVVAVTGAHKKDTKVLSSSVGLTSCSFDVSKDDLEESLGEDNPLMDSALAYVKFKQIQTAFMPSGVPDIYGKKLNISFDEVQDAINKVSVFDPTYGSKKIKLSGNDLKRYTDIGLSISCEYCCGAEAIVFENGSAACGCEHSQMMRGLTAYLIKNHPEMSNQEILYQLVLWKRTYFPKQTLSAELKKMQDSGDEDVKQVLQEFPDFLPDMVGSC